VIVKLCNDVIETNHIVYYSEAEREMTIGNELLKKAVVDATPHPLHTPQAEPFIRHARTILTKCFN
jgi:hypothetical protein